MKRHFINAWLIFSTCFISINSYAAHTSIGTGFFVTKDGYLITNNHVIENGTDLTIRLKNGSIKKVNLVRIDEANDLAILKAEGDFSAIPIIDSRDVKKGANVITVGFPNVDIQGFEPKLSEGIISSVTGVGDMPNVFQISTPIQDGNSGGPLVASTGNVVGVVVSKLSHEYMLRKRRSIPENVNFAIKSNYILEVIRTIPSLEARLLKPLNRPFRDLIKLAEHVEKSTVIVVAEVGDQVRSDAVQSTQPVTPPEEAIDSEIEIISRKPEFLEWLRNQPEKIKVLAESKSSRDKYFLIALFLVQSSKQNTETDGLSVSEKYLLNSLSGMYKGEKNLKTIVSEFGCKQSLKVENNGQVTYLHEKIFKSSDEKLFVTKFVGSVVPGSLGVREGYYFLWLDGNWSRSYGVDKNIHQKRETASLLFNESGIIRIENAEGADSTCGAGFSRK